MSDAIDHTEAERIARDAVAGNAIYSRRLLARAYLDMAAEIERLSADNARLREALTQSRDWFQQYADGHTAKGDTDKAKRNQDRADFCARATTEASNGK